MRGLDFIENVYIILFIMLVTTLLQEINNVTLC